MSNQQKQGDKPDGTVPRNDGNVPRNDPAPQDSAAGRPPDRPEQRQQDPDYGRQSGRFTVEFGDDFCRNFTINSPPFGNYDIRGRWDVGKIASREEPGRTDFGPSAARIPTPIPGAMLEVDVGRRRVRLFDPLMETEQGKKILERYNAVAATVPALTKNCKGFEAVERTLDEDQLKTLLLELHRKMESKCLNLISGEFPTLRQVESLGGRELYDPANPGDDKPRYKEDLPAWKDKMRAAGV